MSNSKYPFNFIDECCFGDWLESVAPENQSLNFEQSQNTYFSKEDLNFIDAQYFVSTTSASTGSFEFAPSSSSFSSSSSMPPSTWSLGQDDSLNFIDAHYFANPSSPNFLNPKTFSNFRISRNFYKATCLNSSSQIADSYRDSGSTEFSPLQPDRDNLPPIVSLGSPPRRSSNDHRQNKSKRRSHEDDDMPVSASEALPSESATEMAKRLRREGRTSAYDAKGYRIYLREDCTPIELMTREQLVQYLVRDCLIYADGQLVAFNKPYGLHVTRTLSHYSTMPYYSTTMPLFLLIRTSSRFVNNNYNIFSYL